ncbi:MAG: DNA-processing protein DprA, partial [Armatimonadetes bacterium]|nr:DNA-processing protein DprA [Armatimonadota bacterium]
MTEREAWLALNAAELPPRTVLDLLDHYGSPDAIIAAGARSVAQAAQLSPREVMRLSAAAKRTYRPDLDKLDRLGARLITIRDSEYPSNLRQIYDPPPLLFVRGSITPEDARCVAVVGTRRVTPYGRLVSETLARDLA